MKTVGSAQWAVGSKQPVLGGVASGSLRELPERQSLSARCGGKAASAVVLAMFSLPRFVISVFCLLIFAYCTPPTAHGQLVPQGNSPLYSSRPYEARAPSGLPKALNGVGIDQKLNEQLPLDLVLKDEKGGR